MSMLKRYEEKMGLADDLARQRKRDRDLAAEWEAAVLSGDPPPDIDWKAMDEREWRHPAHRRCILLASAITPGAAEAYGWRRYWVVLAVDEWGLADEEKAYRYAQRWARRRELRLEGCPYWESPADLDNIGAHVIIPQRFDAGEEKR